MLGLCISSVPAGHALNRNEWKGATKMQDSQKRNGANGKEAASALIYNLETLARVLRPVVTPERLLGWSLGIVYLRFRALTLANISRVLERIRSSSPRLG